MHGCLEGCGCDWGNREEEALNFLEGEFWGIGCCCVWERSCVRQAEEEEGARTIRKPPSSSFTIRSNFIRSATMCYRHDSDIHLR